ncbi:NADH-dependent glutamate dehydrogenase [Suillus ampliporus]|nr:NADH-dependent glutamate dehydrogenase [Suillus ampliporus]
MTLLNGHDSGVSTEQFLQRISNLPGYTTPIFQGKDEQRTKVQIDVIAKGFIPRELVANEVNWFYSQLGIDDTYFENESSSVISDHIIALFGAKILAYTKHDLNKLVIDLEKVDEKGNGATFIHTSSPGMTSTEGPGATCESRIDSLYLDNSTPSECYRLETFRSTGSISAASKQLRCYFITKCNFLSPPPPPTRTDGRTDIRTVSDSAFLERATPHTLRVYQKIMWQVESRYGPVMEVFEVEGTRERRLVIGYKMGGTSRFFSALSHLYHFYQLYSARKYVEQFSNGITIISLYLNPIPNSTAAPIEHSIFQVMKEASLLYCLPDNPFFRDSVNSGHAVQEATYAYCGWVFAQHFCNRLGPAYHHLKNILDESNPSHAEVLNDIKRRFREETFTRESIAQVIHAHAEIIRLLYVNFAMVHYPAADQASRLRPTLSYQRLQTTQPLSDSELHDKIRRAVPNKQDLQVLESFLIFNKHILKTNFYQPNKVALSFRLAPKFLPQGEYPQPLFGMFLVIGNEFRGFHIRFRDVARGGIRIVMSSTEENYMINKRMLFDENYGLAATQSLKNKDIPEGGAKGTILPSLGAPSRRCFEKYIDAIIDLLIPSQSSGIKERQVDLYGKPELLFFGPDEGTADMMDWAALHARDRGAETWWKTFTTGKSAQLLGGVPHDTCGMTSLSIRQYVLGIYKQLGLREKDITKVQTGGPDGDLGSNEILLSSDKTIAVIDGSGVLADPVGINRNELVRLAKLRVPVSHFDKTKLSKDGYLVKIEEQDVKLPSGEVVSDGTDFRNGAHFRFKADLFVPCGGRPEAVNVSNVAALTDTEGKPHFKYIVEGANLFFTQQARLHLEKRRVIVFKDSSANKGGVTSSSLEVLAGLALTTQEYVDLMIFKDGKPSDFYQHYVKDIQAKITENAAAEFHCIWQEHIRLQGAKPRTEISDELSIMLTELQDKLEHSSLFNDVPSRKGVMRIAIPRTLVDQVGLDILLERLPEAYQRALFSSWVASHFIYKYGVHSSTIDFFHFARDLARE